MATDLEDPKDKTLERGRDREEVSEPPPPTPQDLEPAKKVALRIPESYIAVARLGWAAHEGGGAKVQHQCQNLLEGELRSLASQAHQRAMASANRSLDRIPNVLDRFPRIDPDESTTQVNVVLSRYAHLIALDLALTPSGPGSVQTVCEPMLCGALDREKDLAIRKTSNLLDSLRRGRAKT